MRALDQMLEAMLGEAVWHIAQSLHRGPVNTAFHIVRAEPRQDGMRHRTIEKRHGHTIGIEGGAEANGRHGPIEAVPHVLFPRPDHLDWPTAHGFGHSHGLPHVVIVEAAAKSTAQEAIVDIDVLRRHAGHFRGGGQGPLRVLRSHPHVHALRRACAVQFIGSMAAWAR